MNNQESLKTKIAVVIVGLMAFTLGYFVGVCDTKTSIQEREPQVVEIEYSETSTPPIME